MENEVTAPWAGTVAEVSVAAGAPVTTGQADLRDRRRLTAVRVESLKPGGRNPDRQVVAQSMPISGRRVARLRLSAPGLLGRGLWRDVAPGRRRARGRRHRTRLHDQGLAQASSRRPGRLPGSQPRAGRARADRRASTRRGGCSSARDGMTVNEEALKSSIVGALEPGAPGSVRELRVELTPGPLRPPLQHVRPLHGRHAHRGGRPMTLWRSRAFRPFAPRARRTIVAIFLTFALVSTASAAISIWATGRSKNRATVIEVAARQRTLAERYVAELLLAPERRYRRSETHRLAARRRVRARCSTGARPRGRRRRRRDDDRGGDRSRAAGPARAGAAARRGSHRLGQRLSERPPGLSAFT